MTLETFRRGGEMHPPLPTIPQISTITAGAYVRLGVKRKSGHDLIDVWVTEVKTVFAPKYSLRFKGTILGKPATPIEFSPENIREITET